MNLEAVGAVLENGNDSLGLFFFVDVGTITCGVTAQDEAGGVGCHSCLGKIDLWVLKRRLWPTGKPQANTELFSFHLWKIPVVLPFWKGF